MHGDAPTSNSLPLPRWLQPGFGALEKALAPDSRAASPCSTSYTRLPGGLSTRAWHRLGA